MKGWMDGCMHIKRLSQKKGRGRKSNQIRSFRQQKTSVESHQPSTSSGEIAPPN
jgi:hypothetical protein